jgi:hypothetical protein
MKEGPVSARKICVALPSAHMINGRKEAFGGTQPRRDAIDRPSAIEPLPFISPDIGQDGDPRFSCASPSQLCVWHRSRTAMAAKVPAAAWRACGPWSAPFPTPALGNLRLQERSEPFHRELL